MVEDPQNPYDVRDYEPSRGLLYALGGIAALVAGVMALADAGGDDVITALGGAGIGTGLYLIVVGAVARGLQVGTAPLKQTIRSPRPPQ